MGLLAFLVVSFVVLLAAYRVIGNWLARLFALRTEADTPAWSKRDGLDFEPARTSYLLPQHFSAIAAAGPIVGPILAGLYFGWGPAWLWVIIGAIFVGGIHDFTALIASVRHGGQSIAEIVRRYMNPRAHVLFMIFVWFALVYVIVAFTDVTAATFVAKASTAGAEAPGPAVATSSVLYLVLAIAMGAVLRLTKLGPLKAKLVFLPLVLGAIVVGPAVPLEISGLLPEGSKITAQQVWGYLLLGYCLFAAIAPVWLLLQPRGELGGYFLYAVMIAAALGIAIGAFTGGVEIRQPFFKGWNAPADQGGMPLLPVLFITVACGACSGFHSIIASGTTSKQLARESDAKPVAYGSMLLEALFACISLATVMVLADTKGQTPNGIYANGIATFARTILAPIMPAAGALSDDALFGILYQFALLCFATFVFDTLDACTRLARYVLMEAFGWTTRAQALGATAITLLLPALVIAIPAVDIDGKAQPLWRVFWEIFGSSNQLLAALTLLGVTVWLARRGMAWWLTLPPTVLMMAMTLWSLALRIGPYLKRLEGDGKISAFVHVQFAITVMLMVLASWLVVEALIVWKDIRAGRNSGGGVRSAEAQPA